MVCKRIVVDIVEKLVFKVPFVESVTIMKKQNKTKTDSKKLNQITFVIWSLIM